MAVMPCEYPWLYCTNAEWAVTRRIICNTCNYKIDFFWNGCTSYKSNSSTTTTATMKNQLWINFTDDAFSSHPSIMVQNYGDAGQSVLTTDIASVTSDDFKQMKNLLYGDPDPVSHGSYPPGICGTWTEWPFYLAYGLTQYKNSDGTADTTKGFWNVKAAYRIFLAASNQNTHIYTHHIDFGKSLVTSQWHIAKFAPPGPPGSHRNFLMLIYL
jgi:hypothetical protein